MELLKFDGRVVGPGQEPYFIAEIGSNHNGDMELAKKLIDAAVDAGADAVKFQSWSKNSLICKSEYERNTEYADKHRHFGSLEEMCEKYQLTTEQHQEAAEYCRSKGVSFLSTPFSNEEADLLVELGVPFFKVASMDVNNLPFLAYLGNKGLPVVMSTGMASMSEIDQAVNTLVESGAGPVCLLHCISIYPPEMGDVHLNNIPMLSDAFGLSVGFSDHSIGVEIPLAAIALGACIIEKHFTIDRDMEGWDHWISATPEEMTAIVNGGHNIFKALGSTKRIVSQAELDKREKFRRSAVAKGNLSAGTVLTMEHLDFKRPGTGIGPDKAEYLVGRTLKVGKADDEMIAWDDLQ